MGMVIGSTLSGYLSDYGFAGGWPSVFYVSGLLAFVAFCVWVPLTKSNPEDSKFVSKSELSIIRDGDLVGKEKERVKAVPWLKIFTSGAVWALIVTKFFHAATQYILLTKLPFYMGTVLNVSSTNVRNYQFSISRLIAQIQISSP